MKFVSQVLGNVEGIQNFYIAGIIIFLVLFVIVVYRTLKIPKSDLINYKSSILDDNAYTNTFQNKQVE